MSGPGDEENAPGEELDPEHVPEPERTPGDEESGGEPQAQAAEQESAPDAEPEPEIRPEAGIHPGFGAAAPFDARSGFDSSGTDEFGEDSPTWGAADPDFDRMLRDRIGHVEPLPTPPFAFERVLLSGRRRRARKLWAGATAAALVVMAGTAGTTVALHSGQSTNLGVASGPSNTTVLVPTDTASSATPTAAASPSPSPSASPSQSSTPSSTVLPSATSAATPQCHSTDLNPSAKTESVSGTTATLLVVLTNTSGHDCTTDGYPGLQFAPAGGSPLQAVTETRVSTGLKHRVTVPAGGTVTSTVTYQTLTADATPQSVCYTPSVYVLVIPPNEQEQVMGTITGGPVTVCANGAVSLTPLVAGS
ncbi:DUF4232 domain-containing protein [Actinospica durhamensis]|uniref:DUF4232 domain-containing protein n=1 Tax=Actinospica durhamensis TaxID=1508375 RepID=A0A941IUS7_9ACTN|nr:DUF4232 domain-containing protein [Actinospica durhamensis]MBR7835976.1 DUF4232 domain-containing protein [Actinospica durhamensis]